MDLLPRNRLSLSIALLCFGCWGPSAKEQLFEKLEVVQQQVHRLKTETDPEDPAFQELIVECNEQLKVVQDLIIEDEYQQALEILDALGQKLEREGEPESKPVVARDDPVMVFGKVEFRTADSEAFKRLTGGGELQEVVALRTDVRSALFVTLGKGSQLELTPVTEVTFETFEPGENRIGLNLVKGTLLWTRGSANGEYVLTMDDFQAEVESGSALEIAKEVLTGTRYIAVYNGGISWRHLDREGRLGKYRGLIWLEEGMAEVTVPVRPKIDAPEDQILIEPSGEGATQVAFRWHSGVHIPQYQLQVSDHPRFVTRVFDKTGIVAGGYDVPLEVGTYHWRVRGFSSEGIPGPYSRSATFFINKGVTSQDPGSSSAGRDEGPPIRGVNIEIISTMAIVSGRTTSQARVNVNGVTAVMMEGGRFRAILNFLEEGNHELRIIATDTATGAETVLEKTVLVKF